jgi:hypothetical protein
MAIVTSVVVLRNKMNPSHKRVREKQGIRSKPKRNGMVTYVCQNQRVSVVAEMNSSEKKSGSLTATKLGFPRGGKQRRYVGIYREISWQSEHEFVAIFVGF